ncbi:MAG TPA: hypothetical protein DDW52_18985 [Planctomycetaceae bacterium]|nr:hypothetical protein [Planctomycetaceae bacterium]
MEWTREVVLAPLGGRTLVTEFTLEEPTEFWHDAQQQLSPDEQHRAQRYKFENVRRRFVVCRFRVRQLLAKLLGCHLTDVVFQYGKWGKPELDVTQFPKQRQHELARLHFNVSNSSDTGMLAVSGQPVGIDVEVLERPFKYTSVASLVLAELEQPLWNKVQQRDRNIAMLRLWVCKEAILKAMGLGIAEGLGQVAFDLPIYGAEQPGFSPTNIDPSLLLSLDDDGTCSMNDWVDTKTWTAKILYDSAPKVAAIVTHRHAQQIEFVPYASITLAE